MRNVSGTLSELLAAATSVVGIGLIVVGAYFGGFAVQPIVNCLLMAGAGVVLFASSMIYLLRRDSELSDQLQTFLRDVFLST